VTLRSLATARGVESRSAALRVDAALERLARSTERYCVVGQSLARPPAIVVRRDAPVEAVAPVEA
jgi:hypothetical protein